MSEREMSNSKRVPIRKRVMMIVLMTTLVSLLAASVTGVAIIDKIKGYSEAALTDQLERNLKSMVQQKAVLADAKLEHYEKYIEFVTDTIEQMYLTEEALVASGRLFDPPRDSHEYALTRGFAGEDMTEEMLGDELRFFSHLEKVWEPIAKENENLITTIYAGTKRGLLSSYDRYSYLSAVPEGEELVYDYFQSDWYTRGLEAQGPFFTGLYVDSQGRGLTITVASPFHNARGEVVGVDCADFDITGLYNEMLAFDLGEDTCSFALDRAGNVISPDAENASFEAVTGLLREEAEALKDSPGGMLVKGENIYVCIPIERVGWTLCARVPRKAIQSEIIILDRAIRRAFFVFVGVAALILLLAALAVNRGAANITYPMELLGRDMKRIADGDLNHRAKVYRNDEIGDVTRSLNDMVDRLKATMSELSTTQERADAMSRLATRDSLTGVRNKTAFDEQARLLAQALEAGNQNFGFVVIDLNNLKDINDTYGHDKGDIAIRKLCAVICEVFAHSPVFRVGGDEFVVILENSDYEDIAPLAVRFRKRIVEMERDTQLAPWNRVSAAIGYALYDATVDRNVDEVLTRADRAMYRCKNVMKRR